MVAIGLVAFFMIWQAIFWKGLTASHVADLMESFVKGDAGIGKVDEFECCRVRSPRIDALRDASLKIGHPETWSEAAEADKTAIRAMIDELRQMHE